ncbi:unnamed protein product, partial [Thlaspi arvense]
MGVSVIILSPNLTLSQTYTGNALIAINPFQSLPDLYDTHVMEQYKGMPLGELSPHIFAIADIAYRQMVNEGKSNSILVSGESGAGKTETTKMLMRYMAYVGGHKGTEGRTVEQQVLESNPVLEAFGNAKTVRNNNSSQYILLFFKLLKSHQEIEKYKLENASMFHYLNQSHCYELDGVSDADDYLATRRAMDVVGISHQEQDAIFRVVAAVLHLGNVEFAKGEEIDSSVLKDERSKFHLQTTSELLMCDPVALEDALLKRVMITPEEVIKRSLDPVAAAVSRDGLAKTIYSRLFDWLVDKINVSIGQDPNSKTLIGLLDIYGFESFITNSFEQFCINFTNEKLQQQFNQHVFKMEQEEYMKEEIDWSYIEFVDNQDVLDLIEKEIITAMRELFSAKLNLEGLLLCLMKPGEETCLCSGIASWDLYDVLANRTRKTDSYFWCTKRHLEKLYQTFKSHKRFIKPKLSRTDFTIAHYAGEVQYQSEQFLDKNKGYVVAEHQDLLSASKCSFVSGLFPPVLEESIKSSSKSSKFASIGSHFKLQLQQLMDTLNSTEPHYIRCVKPNNFLKPAIFENGNIIQQLRCGGVLEAIRISCSGYPTHKTFSEFINRFGLLAPEVLAGNFDEIDVCRKLLEKMGLTGFQMGKTKVFLRAGQMAELDTKRSEKLNNAANVIQRESRTYITRQKYIALQKATICIQSILRGNLGRQVYINRKMEAAALRIQANLRRFFVRMRHNKLKFSAVVLQKVFRNKRHTKASIYIQAHWRGHKAYSYHKKLKGAAIIAQCGWRAKIARIELHRLKMAARETGALKAAKDRLEKRVEELTLCLQLEKRLRVDLEEEKGQEIAKLQDSLQALQSQVGETNPLVLEECEVAQREMGGALSVVKASPVLIEDTGKIETLTEEVENLKALLHLEKKRADESERKLVEALETSEERRKRLEETERRVLQLQESLN